MRNVSSSLTFCPPLCSCRSKSRSTGHHGEHPALQGALTPPPMHTQVLITYSLSKYEFIPKMYRFHTVKMSGTLLRVLLSRLKRKEHPDRTRPGKVKLSNSVLPTVTETRDTHFFSHRDLTRNSVPWARFHPLCQPGLSSHFPLSCFGAAFLLQ